jgi:hypothetical protein
MKYTYQLLILAVALSAAAPAFADKILETSVSGQNKFLFAVESQHKFALQDDYATSDFRLGISRNPEFRSEFSRTLQLANARHEEWLSDRGDFFGIDDRAKWKRKSNGWDIGDDHLAAVPVSEPKTPNLVLFGFALVGMLVYRRITLKNAI